MSIPFVRDMAFAYGVADQVSPLIRRLVARNPGPFTYLGTGTFIVGRGAVAVIDPGPEDEAHLAAILQATAGERITDILVTHTHMDHSPLARPLARVTGAKVSGQAAPGVDTGFEEADEAAFVPDVNLRDGDRVEGPGWTLEAMATPGHASNHLAFALLEENALFSGDHVMGWSTTVISPPDGDMGDYFASLDKVQAGGFTTLWPTHGPPITDPGPFLDAYRAHRQEREEQILAQLAAGRTRIKAIVEQLYAATPSRLHPAAAHSVWAHLIQLDRQGRVRCDGLPALESEYRLASPLRGAS